MGLPSLSLKLVKSKTGPGPDMRKALWHNGRIKHHYLPVYATSCTKRAVKMSKMQLSNIQ